MDAMTKILVFSEYGKQYSTILDSMYPAKNSTGFPERNLSVNFSRAYERIAASREEQALTWFEFQFGDDNNLHVDAVILNSIAHEMIVIEAKRYNNPIAKMKEVGKDIDRIFDFVKELRLENQSGIKRIDVSNIKRVYGLILADIWTETDLKLEIKASYEAGVINWQSEQAFLNKYRDKICSTHELSEVDYDVCTMTGDETLTKYNLLSILWNVGGESDDLS